MKRFVVLFPLICLLFQGFSFAQTPFLVKDIVPGPVWSHPNYLFNYTDTLIFTAGDPGSGSGRELWKSDGSTANTVMIADAVPGSGGLFNNSSINPSFTISNGLLFFIADDGINGLELWKTDGTSAVTQMVKDINPGSSWSDPSSLVNFNDTLYFSANDGVHGSELWKSDGTSAGTVMVKDIWTGYYGSNIFGMIKYNGALYFSALDSVNGYELWKSDGTSAGTQLLKDINTAFPNAGSFIQQFMISNGELFFNADDGVHGDELWKTDGTPSGTVMVADIWPGLAPSSPASLVEMNGTLFFNASEMVNGSELWKSDGTVNGTVLVKDCYPGPGDSQPFWLNPANSKLFFHSTDSANGTELWRSDGTASGTFMIDVCPGTGSAFNFGYPWVAMNDTLYFTATNGSQGEELWRSDGTIAGTTMVMDIYPGSSGSLSSFPFLININGTLFFNPSDGQIGSELWAMNVDPGVSVTVNENTVTDNLILFPNPSSDFSTINFKSPTELKGTVVKVYDSMGKEVKSVIVTNNSATLKREGLNNGIYFVRVFTADKIIGSGKWIVE